jgi:hypothetical protein
MNAAEATGLPNEVGDKFIAENGEKRFLAQVLSRLDDVPKAEATGLRVKELARGAAPTGKGWGNVRRE